MPELWILLWSMTMFMGDPTYKVPYYEPMNQVECMIKAGQLQRVVNLGVHFCRPANEVKQNHDH